MSAKLPTAASFAIVHLMKGVVYRDSHEDVWRDILDQQTIVRDYVLTLFLDLVIDESEGYAFLRQLEPPSHEGGERDIPRLIQRRPLSFGVSLLCVLLRKHMAEQDATSADSRLIMSRGQIGDLARVFLASSTNEARTDDLIDGAIVKLTDYGLLRRLRSGGDELFEVRRIIKALVDASWLADMNEKLEVYKKHADNTL